MTQPRPPDDEGSNRTPLPDAADPSGAGPYDSQPPGYPDPSVGGSGFSSSDDDTTAYQPTPGYQSPTYQPPAYQSAVGQPPTYGSSGQPYSAQPPVGGQAGPPPGYQPSAPYQQPYSSQPPNPQPTASWNPSGQPINGPGGWQTSQPPSTGWTQPQDTWGTQQPGWGDHLPNAPYGRSALSMIAALILLLSGVLFTLVGAVALMTTRFITDVVNQAIENTPGFEAELQRANMTAQSLVDILVAVVVVIMVLGILKMLAALGIFAHKSWARYLGIVLGALFLLFSLAGLAGGGSIDQGNTLGFTVLMVVAYGTVLIGLVVGSHHFRRQGTPQ